MQGHGVCVFSGPAIIRPSKKEKERGAKTGDPCTPACLCHVDCPRRLPGSIRVDAACAQGDAGWDRAPDRPAFPNPDHESGDHPCRSAIRTQLDQLLEDLYDPTSPSYQQFLTVEQFTAQFGPTQQDYDAVINFAQENNLTVVGTSPNRLIVRVSGTAANVEAAFHVNLNVYQHPTENRTFYAPDREPTTT